MKPFPLARAWHALDIKLIKYLPESPLLLRREEYAPRRDIQDVIEERKPLRAATSLAASFRRREVLRSAQQAL